MFHRDEAVINTWINYLRQQCKYYTSDEMAQIFTFGRKLGYGKFAEVIEATNKYSG